MNLVHVRTVNGGLVPVPTPGQWGVIANALRVAAEAYAADMEFALRERNKSRAAGDVAAAGVLQAGADQFGKWRI